jgi:hypothetical protein
MSLMERHIVGFSEGIWSGLSLGRPIMGFLRGDYRAGFWKCEVEKPFGS